MPDNVSEGQISISRRSHSTRENCIAITIREMGSRTTLCELEMTAEAFGQAVTGMAGQECELHWNPEQLKLMGMKKEVHTEKIEIPLMLMRSDVRDNEEVAKAMKHLTDEGWIPHWDDLSNHHRRSQKDGKGFASVGFHRHVPKESDDVQP